MNPRLAKLPRWKDIPIPFFVTWRTDGIPDFKVINEGNRAQCAKENLCFICGEPLEYWIFFAGGPQAIKRGLFVDGPMHRECCDDALVLCPFLRGDMDYAKNFDMSKHSHEIRFTSGASRLESQKPPDKIGVVRTRGFQVAIYTDPRDKRSGGWFFYTPRIVETTWRDR